MRRGFFGRGERAEFPDYDPMRDLAPVSRLAEGPLVLVVHPSLPARSVKALTALAKARPGELNAGNSGTGSLPHLTAELFATQQFTEFLTQETAKYARVIQTAGVKPE